MSNNVIPIEKPEVQEIDRLAYEWSKAKRKEAEARERRADIEERIAAIIGVKEEGTVTLNTDWYKITTNGGFNRSVDRKVLDNIERDIPPQYLGMVFDYKPSLRLKEFRTLKKTDPEIHRLVSKCITAKPKKTAISVKKLEQ